MIIFSRKTNGCWVPPFKKTPIYASIQQKVFHLQGFGFVQRIHSQKHDEATAVDGEGLLLDSRRWLPTR